MKKYRIEFGELVIGDLARQNLMHCCDTNWASGGPKVKQFEKEWGELFNYPYNKAVSSGTDAVFNACLSLYDFGAKRGDEIIVPALGFIATSNAALCAGFTPVFVDVEKHTLNINPHAIEAKVTPKTRAIIAVHTMGKPCEMDTINDIAKRHNLFVIEDAAEAHGARYRNKYIGEISDMATFSFYIAHLICCGEGGMVSTLREDVADVINSTRTHGRKNGDLYFDHQRIGYNSKLNDLEASLGLEGVRDFWKVFNTRKRNLKYLMELTSDLEEFAWFNREEDYEVVCPHAFTVTLKDPRFGCKQLSDYLEGKGVKVKRNFGSIPTQHKAYDFMNHQYGEFPEAEYIGDNGIHFGVHQYLKEDDMIFVSQLLHNYFWSL